MLGLAFHLILMALAVILAVYCNPDRRLLLGLVALVVPEIYLLQFGVRKYLLKEPGYCPININLST